MTGPVGPGFGIRFDEPAAHLARAMLSAYINDDADALRMLILADLLGSDDVDFQSRVIACLVQNAGEAWAGFAKVLKRDPLELVAEMFMRVIRAESGLDDFPE